MEKTLRPNPAEAFSIPLKWRTKPSIPNASIRKLIPCKNLDVPGQFIPSNKFIRIKYAANIIGTK